jgi:type IV pilus assembly protein PilW
MKTLPSSRGFSLIEVMVGLVIGMIGMVVMMQVFSLSEGKRRGATGGDDAQTNGAIAMYGMQSEIRQAGYGNSSTRMMGCNLLLRAGVTFNTFAPVTVNHADIPPGDANTDTIVTATGNPVDSPEGDTIVSNATQTAYSTTVPSAFKTGDYVIAVPLSRPSPCALVLEKSGSVTAAAINVPTGVANMARGTLFNMGNAPRIQAYAVRHGNLTVCDFMASNCTDASKKDDASFWVPIAANVVSLRAEYGRDTSATADGIVDAFNQTAPTTACQWSRVAAVRFLLVSRNGQYEKTLVTTQAMVDRWTAAPAYSGLDVDLSGDADWQHYRYRTFRTVVPLRNITSLGAQPGC